MDVRGVYNLIVADVIDLMRRYCDGDAASFRALYREVAPRLQGYLARMTGDPVLATELVQQTFLKLHHHRSAYVRGADPVPWIYGFAQQTVLAHARKLTSGSKRLMRGGLSMTEAGSDRRAS